MRGDLNCQFTYTGSRIQASDRGTVARGILHGATGLTNGEFRPPISALPNKDMPILVRSSTLHSICQGICQGCYAAAS